MGAGASASGPHGDAGEAAPASQNKHADDDPHRPLPPASPPKDVDMDKLSPGKVYTRKKLAFNVLHAGEAAELRIVTAVAKANVVLQRGSGVVLENLPLKDIRSWVRHANGVVLNVDVLAKSGKVKTDARIVAMECVGGEDPRVITDALVRNCGVHGTKSFIHVPW